MRSMAEKWYDDGLQRGLCEGRQEGRQEVTNEILKSGMPVDQISVITDLPLEILQASANRQCT